MGLTDEPFDLVERLSSARAVNGGGDELLALFFLLLWKRSNGGRQVPPLNVAIVDTVVLHHSRPIWWFFRSKDGSIKMKGKKHMTTEVIIDDIMRHAKSASGCVSQFVSHSESKPEGYDIAFQTVADIATFVSANATPGVLQRFVDPKKERGELHNAEIVPSWTPNVFYIERRVNSCKLATSYFDIADRCSASEACRFVKTEAVVSTHTMKVIEDLCHRIALHIDMVFRCRVTSMTIHVKVTDDDTPYVLRCSALRLMSGSAMDEGPSRVVSVSLQKPSVQSIAAERAARRASPRARGDEGGGGPDGGSPCAGDGARSVDDPFSPMGSGSSPSGDRSTDAKDEFRDRTCRLCARRGRDAKLMSHVRQEHVLFPLAVLDYWSKQVAQHNDDAATPAAAGANEPHAAPRSITKPPSSDPGSSFDFMASDWQDGAPVPSFVRVLHPTMTPEQYARQRNTVAFQRESITLCSRCAASLEITMHRMHVDSDGAMSDPLGLGHAQRLAKLRSAANAAAAKDAAVEGQASPVASPTADPQGSTPVRRKPPGLLAPLARTPEPLAPYREDLSTLFHSPTSSPAPKRQPKASPHAKARRKLSPLSSPRAETRAAYGAT